MGDDLAAAPGALAGDIVVAGETSFLQIGEIQQGAGIPMNAAWLRLKTTEAVIARLVLQGDRVPAPEVHRFGLTHELTPDDDVAARCEAIAQRLAGFPTGSARRVRADMRHHLDIDREAWFVAAPAGALLDAPRLDD